MGVRVCKESGVECMCEAFIVGLVWVVNWRVLGYGLVVDDVRRVKDVLGGLYERCGGLRWCGERLYGVGTFAWRCCRGEDRCVKCVGSGGWRVNVRVERVLTVLMTSVVGVLIYWVFGRGEVSLAAAVLYVINPVNHQVTVWLNGRRYMMVVVVVLLMMLVPYGILLYPLTYLFHGSGIFAPVVLGLGWEWVFVPFMLLVNRKRLKKFVGSRLKMIVSPDLLNWSPKRLLVCVKMFGFHFWQMVFPWRVRMSYGYLSEWGMNREGNEAAYRIDLRFWLGVAALGLGVGGLFTEQRWYFLFILIGLGQWCGVVSVFQYCADRYVSVVNIFVMYLLSFWTYKLFGFYGTVVLVGVAGYYLAELLHVMEMYRDMDHYFEYHRFYDPKNPVVGKFHVNARLQNKDVLGAWELVKEGLKHHPTDFTTLFQAGVVTQALGDVMASEEYFSRAEKNYYIGQEEVWKGKLGELRKVNRDFLEKNRTYLKPKSKSFSKKS